MNGTWQDVEAEYDIAREQLRAEKHSRLAIRRADHFWPLAAPIVIAGGLILAAAIQGGAL